MSIIEEIQKLWELVKTPGGLLLATFALAWLLTARHLKREKPGERDHLPLKNWLAAGGFSGLYTERLTAILDYLDRWLMPPENHPDYTGFRYTPDLWPATDPRRAWNWWAYDRMLLLAVVYPILTPAILWIFFASPASLGGLEVLSAPQAWWQQTGLGLSLTLLLFYGPVARWVLRRIGRPVDAPDGWDHDRNSHQAREMWLRAILIVFAVAVAVAFAFAVVVAVAVAVAVAGAVAVAVAYAVAGAFGVAGAVAVAFAVAVAVAVAFAVAVAGAFSVAVAVAFASASAVAVAFASAVAVAFASAVAVALDRRWHPGRVFVAFTLGLLILLVLAAWVLQGWENDAARVVFLFLGLFPILNAVFDFASLGLTRYCLRQSLDGREFRLLGHDLKSLVWWGADVAGAIATLFALCATLLIAVVLVNHLAAEPVLDLPRLFADIKGRSDMRWLYFMVFSTLLPTIAHLLLFWISIPIRFPGSWMRTTLASWITTGKDGDDRTTFVCAGFAAIATLWVGATIVAPWIGWPHLGDLHRNIVMWFVGVFEGFANWLETLLPPRSPSP